MAKRIFVSYNFSDRIVAQTVKQMIQSKQQDIEGKLVFVENDVSYNGASAIDWEIARTMQGCKTALFVIGENPQNSPWLNQEAVYAIDNGMSILMVQLPQTFKGCIPDELAGINCIRLSWNENEIVACLNQY